MKIFQMLKTLLVALSVLISLAGLPALAQENVPVGHEGAPSVKGTQANELPGSGGFWSAQSQTGSVPLSFHQLRDKVQADDPALSAGQKHELLRNALYEHNILALAWAVALALSVTIYLILDGADLGAGIISLFYGNDQTRGAIMASMAGTWDANETWLVVAGGILFGGFPFIYGSVFHYLMLPLMVLLLGIMLRAVSLEFHHHAARSQRFWGLGFAVGSLVVAFLIGAAGGAVLDGVQLTPRTVTYAGGGTVLTFTGGLFDFISPFSIWTGIVGVITSVFAGALYLRARFVHDSPVRADMKDWVNGSFIVLVIASVITLGWIWLRFPWAAQKWTGPWIWGWGVIAVWVLYALWNIWDATRRERDLAAMVWYAVMTASSLGAMALTVYPWLVPGTWTVYDAADPSLSLVGFTVAMGGFIPVILIYNWYQIWVFRDRLSALGTYDHH
ncbi:cytochrome d ubiquinol oxidase subunit II [Thioclava sp. 15-R06ZXC-3]|uniref:Cytochrome d ubiquinol oxidase subunit II n=1 Tax=Thioclava arctica TaxID=3238301 RepID=A0ABV3TJQ6_9RHOB